MDKGESSPIDAKKFPLPVVIGGLLLAIGLIVAFYGIYCLVMSAIGEHFMGFIGAFITMGIGVIIMAVGGIFLFAGTIRKFSRGRRILY